MHRLMRKLHRAKPTPKPAPTREMSAEAVFAESVIARRNTRKWSQAELAERLTSQLGRPINQSTVARLEAGKRRIALDDALAIASALDVPLVSMLDGTYLDPWVRVKVVPKKPALHPRQVRKWFHADDSLPWQDAKAFAFALREEKWRELVEGFEEVKA